MGNSVEYIPKKFAKLIENNEDAMSYIYNKSCAHARVCLRMVFGNEMRVNKDGFERALRSWGYCT
jgi:hypothetical protein